MGMGIGCGGAVREVSRHLGVIPSQDWVSDPNVDLCEDDELRITERGEAVTGYDLFRTCSTCLTHTHTHARAHKPRCYWLDSWYTNKRQGVIKKNRCSVTFGVNAAQVMNCSLYCEGYRLCSFSGQRC